MLNLNDLYIFVQVVDDRGFAPAARRLDMPKSTLSKRVAALESQLGVRLIHRSSRRFVLTEIGQDFYRHAAAMLIEAEAAEHVVKGRLAEPSGTVRITASVPTVQIALASLIVEAAVRYPKIRVVLHATDRFVDVVQEGFDLAVRDHMRPLPDSELVQRRVAYDPVYLVTAPIYLDRHGAPQTPAELERHHGLSTTAETARWTLQRDDGEKADVMVPARFAADESTVLLQAAIAGLGIVGLPRKFCRTALESGTLVRVLPEWTGGGVTTTLLMPHRRGQLPSVRAIADLLAERIGGS